MAAAAAGDTGWSSGSKSLRLWGISREALQQFGSHSDPPDSLVVDSPESQGADPRRMELAPPEATPPARSQQGTTGRWTLLTAPGVIPGTVGGCRLGRQRPLKRLPLLLRQLDGRSLAQRPNRQVVGHLRYQVVDAERRRGGGRTGEPRRDPSWTWTTPGAVPSSLESGPSVTTQAPGDGCGYHEAGQPDMSPAHETSCTRSHDGSGSLPSARLVLCAVRRTNAGQHTPGTRIGSQASKGQRLATQARREPTCIRRSGRP